MTSGYKIQVIFNSSRKIVYSYHAILSKDRVIRNPQLQLVRFLKNKINAVIIAFVLVKSNKEKQPYC